MSSLSRGSVALVLSSAFVLAIACGSSSKNCGFGFIAAGQYVVYVFAAGCGAVAKTTLLVTPPA
jgi:hypothetical protein